MKLWSNSSVPGGGSFVPERRLLAAVLQRAVADFLGGEEEMQREAGCWLFSDENGDDEEDPPLTFQFICEALDLDLTSLRRAISQQSAPGTKVALQEAAV